MRFRTFWWGCQILAETKAEGELLRQFYNTMPKSSELLDGMMPDDAGSISILSQGGMDGEFTQAEIDASTFAIAINRGD